MRSKIIVILAFFAAAPAFSAVVEKVNRDRTKAIVEVSDEEAEKAKVGAEVFMFFPEIKSPAVAKVIEKNENKLTFGFAAPTGKVVAGQKFELSFERIQSQWKEGKSSITKVNEWGDKIVISTAEDDAQFAEAGRHVYLKINKESVGGTVTSVANSDMSIDLDKPMPKLTAGQRAIFLRRDQPYFPSFNYISTESYLSAPYVGLNYLKQSGLKELKVAGEAQKSSTSDQAVGFHALFKFGDEKRSFFSAAIYDFTLVDKPENDDLASETTSIKNQSIRFGGPLYKRLIGGFSYSNVSTSSKSSSTGSSYTPMSYSLLWYWSTGHGGLRFTPSTQISAGKEAKRSTDPIYDLAYWQRVGESAHIFVRPSYNGVGTKTENHQNSKVRGILGAQYWFRYRHNLTFALQYNNSSTAIDNDDISSNGMTLDYAYVADSVDWRIGVTYYSSAGKQKEITYADSSLGGIVGVNYHIPDDLFSSNEK